MQRVFMALATLVAGVLCLVLDVPPVVLAVPALILFLFAIAVPDLMRAAGVALLAMIGVLALATMPALAADPAPPLQTVKSIDFGPLLNEYVWPTLAALLSALAAWLFKLVREWLKAKTGLDLAQYDDTVRVYLDEALQRGIDYAKSRIGAEHVTLEVKNDLIRTAAQFVVDHVPDALRHFGLDRGAIERMIEARLAARAARPA